MLTVYQGSKETGGPPHGSLMAASCRALLCPLSFSEGRLSSEAQAGSPSCLVWGYHRAQRPWNHRAKGRTGRETEKLGRHPNRKKHRVRESLAIRGDAAGLQMDFPGSPEREGLLRKEKPQADTKPRGGGGGGRQESGAVCEQRGSRGRGDRWVSTVSHCKGHRLSSVRQGEGVTGGL